MSTSLELNDPLGRRFAELAAAGVAVPEGLEAAASEADSRRLRQALRRLADQLRRGATTNLGSPDSMERLTATLVAGSHNSGDFATALATLEEADAHSVQLRRLLNAAWAYPIAILALSAVCGLVVLEITTHAYAGLFGEYELEQAAGMAFYASFNRFLLWGILGVSAAAVGLATSRLFYRHRWLDSLYGHIPLIGPADRWLDMAVVCAVLSQLLARDVPYPEALRLARASTRSAAIRDWLEQAAADIGEGRSLDLAVVRLGKHADVLPALVEPRGIAAVDPAGGWELAGRYFLRRATDRVRLVRGVVPVIGYLVIVAVVFSVLQAALAPLAILMELITGLSG